MALWWIDLNDQNVLRVALFDQRNQGWIAGVATIPERLVVDLHALPDGEAADPKGHMPRGRYGDFLADAVAAAATLAAAKGIVLQRLPVEVTGLDEPPAAEGGGAGRGADSALSTF